MKPRSRCRKRLDSGSRLDSFLLPSPCTDGRWPNTGMTRGDVELQQRAVERDLPGGRREQVLAAQHVRDAHERVVDRVDQRVQRLAVGAHDDEVRHRTRLERDLAADQVGEGDVVVGHPQAQRGLAALGAEERLLLVGQVAVGAVVAELRVAAGRLVAGLDLLGRRERLVRVARPRPGGAPRPCTGRSAATAGTARAGRRPRRPRPSPGPASAARRAAARTTPASRARRRCPRSGRRTCRPCGGRTPS